MVSDEEKEKRERHAANPEDCLNGEKEAQDEDEGHIELLQSYLKKALNGEDDPNIGT